MLAERIKQYMDEKGIKQTAVAHALDMGKASMNATLNGNRTLTAEEYVAICDFLEVPYSKFTEERKEDD